jgi:hypothetical protein
MKNMRFIDNKIDFTDYKVKGKTVREAFIEMEAEKEKYGRGTTSLIKDHAKNTQYFHDAEANQFPIDAFQVLDLTINLPLNKYWAQELVPIRYGGGAVESFAFFRSNVGLAEGRLAGGNTNEVPLVSISTEKVTVPIYAIKLGIVLGMLDLMKAETVNFSLIERHESALRTSYWREIEHFAFEGNVNIGDITTSTSNFFPGLLNIPVSGAGIYYKIEASEQWSAHDVAEWTTALLTMFATMKQNVRYNRDYFPNTVLVPPTAWTLLQAPATLASGTVGMAQSIMQYVQTEIKSRLQIEVEFIELPYLDANASSTLGFPIEASGAGSTGRIVAYRKDEKVLKLPITMALTGGATLPSPTEDALRKNYVSFTGPLAIVYPESIGYLDNKAG